MNVGANVYEKNHNSVADAKELLTGKGTLSRRGMLSDKGQELVLCLLQGDVTVLYSLRQS